MKVVSVEAIPFSLPVRRDFRWNGLLQGLGRFVLIRISTDTGLVGDGEAVPLPDWGGDFDAVQGKRVRRSPPLLAVSLPRRSWAVIRAQSPRRWLRWTAWSSVIPTRSVPSKWHCTIFGERP